MEYDFSEIASMAKQRFVLSLKSKHGLSHWQRVLENGLKLAKWTGANTDIVRLFAFLHDCCRLDDFADPDHGPRAAEFTESLFGVQICGSAQDCQTLVTAIHDHTHVRHHKEATIATCWDADRLDIGRVGRKPDVRFLSTKAAKREHIINWAYKRSIT